MSSPHFRLVTVLLVVLLAVSGCSGDQYQGRFAISGTAKFRDQPLKNGIVLFEPLDGQDTGANALITDGEFKVSRMSGLKVGKYLVRVTAGDGKTAVNPTNPDEPPGPGGGGNIISRELIPASWNTQSKQEVTVQAEGPNTFPFDIK
jgi:hypothetical protein